MNSDERNNGNMDNIGERYKDKLTEQTDWTDGMNAFREEVKDRMIDISGRLDEVELSLEESIQDIRNYLESSKEKS
tara:strand:+ start:420 stop:647 length:228 start_codon:yes stop_codon:yes gene_type:complete